MQAHYDDPKFFYDKYWQTRAYEHASEEVAIRRLINSKHFSSIADIGGGYGRLSKFLTPFSKKVVLVEPSIKQLNIAKNFLSGSLSLISLQQGTAEKTGLPTSSQDAVLMVRVMHHLPEPQASFNEINRILKPGGLLILEFANSTHFKARIRSFMTGMPILPTPIERRSSSNIRHHTIPFVNHHPSTVFHQLERSGFLPLRTLSVSNFRSPLLKNIFSISTLLYFEAIFQSWLSHIFFGPSIFVLAKKKEI